MPFAFLFGRPDVFASSFGSAFTGEGAFVTFAGLASTTGAATLGGAVFVGEDFLATLTGDFGVFRRDLRAAFLRIYQCVKQKN